MDAYTSPNGDAWAFFWTRIVHPQPPHIDFLPHFYQYVIHHRSPTHLNNCTDSNNTLRMHIQAHFHLWWPGFHWGIYRYVLFYTTFIVLYDFLQIEFTKSTYIMSPHIIWNRFLTTVAHYHQRWPCFHPIKSPGTISSMSSLSNPCKTIWMLLLSLYTFLELLSSLLVQSFSRLIARLLL